ncbi:D-Ala-D-Ala carboxypeptidase [Planctobacterium marinum]|uniref:D-Ala-D-Ala carboxypeptidase n=1 Tax=Planctobacterium marinum TaxID=1631968 RepID=A0AA48HPL6_9ALTE|nr:D-Ala-D-Ala carboxypeptidase [Planctobacterium marinum]
MNIDKSGLDAYLNALNDNNKMMTAVYVSKNGHLVYQHYAGHAFTEDGQVINHDTRFRIGSITKTYTAVLIMQLVEQGELSLQDTLDKHFPSFPNAGKITLHHLLNHRSGIANFTEQADYPNYMTQNKNMEQMLAIIAALPSEFPPGSQHTYSNSNYVVLGFILEQLYKAPLSEIIATRIAKPLGLKNSYFGNTINSKDNEAASYYFAENWQKAPETTLQIPHGAGAMVATAQETNEFTHALFNGKLVNEESLKTMMKLKDGYGLGLFARPFYEQYLWGHNGCIDGFASDTAYNLEDGVAITVLSNGVNYDFNGVLIAILSGIYEKDFDLPDFSAAAVEVSKSNLARTIGSFASGDLPLAIQFFVEKGQLMAQAPGQGAFPLTPYSDSEYRFDGAGIVIKFDEQSEKQGQLQRFVLHQGGGQFRYERK